MIPLRDANPTRRTPLVTLSIVIACFVAFAWELGLMASGGELALDQFITKWGVVPADLVAAWNHGDYLSRETATLVTSQFLHGSWLHLLGNMLYLWIFGNNVEDRFGRLGFLAFYLFGGALAGLSQVAIDPTSTVPTIGASGAIAATRLDRPQLGQSVDQLEDEPEAEDDDRRDVDELVEEAEEDERGDPRPREQHEVGTQGRGDRA